MATAPTRSSASMTERQIDRGGQAPSHDASSRTLAEAASSRRSAAKQLDARDDREAARSEVKRSRRELQESGLLKRAESAARAIATSAIERAASTTMLGVLRIASQARDRAARPQARQLGRKLKEIEKGRARAERLRAAAPGLARPDSRKAPGRSPRLRSYPGSIASGGPPVADFRRRSTSCASTTSLSRRGAHRARHGPRVRLAASSCRCVQEHVRQDGSFPMELVPAHGRARPLRRQPAGLRLRRHEQRGLRARDAGARARRLGAALASPRCRARSCMYPIHAYGSRRAEGALAAGAGGRPRDRLLRADRARLRLPRRAACAPRRAQRRPLGAERHQALDHQRHRSPHVAVVWAQTDDGDPRLPGRDRARRASRRATSRASSRCAPRSPPSSSCTDVEVPEANRLPGAKGLKGAALVPDAGALRHRLGRDRRGAWPATTEALDYAQERIVAGRPARRQAAHRSRSSSFMLTEITKAQLLALRVGRLKDEGKLAPRDGVDGQAEQRRRRARRSRGWRATCSAPTASSTTTSRCGTW